MINVEKGVKSPFFLLTNKTNSYLNDLTKTTLNNINVIKLNIVAIVINGSGEKNLS